jgi:hypothetical protein
MRLISKRRTSSLKLICDLVFTTGSPARASTSCSKAVKSFRTVAVFPPKSSVPSISALPRLNRECSPSRNASSRVSSTATPIELIFVLIRTPIKNIRVQLRHTAAAVFVTSFQSCDSVLRHGIQTSRRTAIPLLFFVFADRVPLSVSATNDTPTRSSKRSKNKEVPEKLRASPVGFPGCDRP